MVEPSNDRARAEAGGLAELLDRENAVDDAAARELDDELHQTAGIGDSNTGLTASLGTPGKLPGRLIFEYQLLSIF